MSFIVNTYLRKPPGEAAWTALICYYKKHAKMFNREYSLSREEFKDIASQNCYYCDIEPPIKNPKRSNKKMSIEGISRQNIKAHGIDRLNNDLGYVFNNCVSCCWLCNRMKSKLSYKDFVNHIYKVICNLKGKQYA